MDTEPDHVARIVAQWRAERPDLDTSPQDVFGRLRRVALRVTEELVAVHAEFGLDEGQFDVLATLRRSGSPYELTPGELAASTLVTSGAITKRVDRCVRQGLVSRRADDRDARGRVVALTPEGLALIDRAFEAHLANQHRLLSPLEPRDRVELARLLEVWGRSLGA